MPSFFITAHSQHTTLQVLLMRNCCPYNDTNGTKSVRFINFSVQLEEYVHVLLLHSTHIKHLENNLFKVILSISK